MVQVAVIDDREVSITAVFKLIEIENIPKSETAGYAVMEKMEVVEVRFAGSRYYSPVFPSDAMWKREGNRVITYAERWADQYRAFKEGHAQEANGTPLEMLARFGVTPEQVSFCRTLRIYSIEALHYLEGQNVKSLGMHANKLKAAAASFMADRSTKSEVMDELALLKAEIAALKASQVPIEDSRPEEIEAAIEAASAGTQDLTDDQVMDEIEKLTKARPKDGTDRETLNQMLDQALAA